jgi:predicted deacylase
MAGRIAAVLYWIEAQQDEQTIPKGISALALLQMVYRGAVKVSPQQMRAAIEALPFEVPKLQAVANLQFNFAVELDRKIEERSKMKLIETRPSANRTSSSRAKADASITSEDLG